MPDRNKEGWECLLGFVTPEGSIHDRKERYRESITVTHIFTSQPGTRKCRESLQSQSPMAAYFR